jgi:hypothetical protein
MNIRRLVAVATLNCSVALGAQGPDPPHSVGRIGQVDGRVSIQADEAPPSAVTMNWPTIAGDRIHTGIGSRTEVTLSGGTLWLGEESTVLIRELSSTFAHLRIESGEVGIHLPDRRYTASVRLEVAGSTVELTTPGDYHLTVRNQDAITFAVETGEATVRTSEVQFNQLAGEEVQIAADGTVGISTASVTKRTRNARGTRSEPHLARNLVGYQELDGHGDWRWAREYGMVWTPHSPPRQWAPYRFGHWIWRAPWGWTWIDSAPWGFATSHYGRWTKIEERWSWLPGPRQIDASFAPALVGWLRDPADAELIGWFPLGPRDEYVPLYPSSAVHKQTLNTVASVGNRGKLPIDSGGSTADIPGAVTWTPRSVFAGHPTPTDLHKHASNDSRALNR